MPYASPDGKRLWAQRYRAGKRGRGECLQCKAPHETNSRFCKLHGASRRDYARAWMRRLHGYQPRYEQPEWGYAERPRFHAEWERPYYETVSGVICRVPVDWRDPLTILIQREAMGLFCFMRDRGLATAC